METWNSGLSGLVIYLPPATLVISEAITRLRSQFEETISGTNRRGRDSAEGGDHSHLAKSR